MPAKRAALAVVTLLLVAAEAHAQAPASTVVVLGDANAVVGDRQLVYHPDNTSRMSLASTRSELIISVTDDEPWPRDESWSLTLSAPLEHELTPGVYDRAWYGFRHDEDARPGIEITGEGRACQAEGRFEVKDLAFGPDDHLDRIWVVYEHWCREFGGPTAGEVRIDMTSPALSAPVIVRPSVLRWGETDLGRENGALAATVLAGAATQIAGVAVGGESPADFPLVSDRCTGASLPAGGSCEVVLRFAPAAAGTRRAALTVTEASGTEHEVTLEGFSWGATTRATLGHESDPSAARTYTPADARFSVGLQGTGIRFLVDNGDAEQRIDAGFSPGAGQPLAPGRYVDPGPREDPANPNLDVNGSACRETSGEFTITDISFHRDGEVRAVGVDFVQYCDGSEAALRGTLDVRKADATPTPPWITGTWGGIPMAPGQYEGGPPWITETVPGPGDGPAPQSGPDPPAPTNPARPCTSRVFSTDATFLGTSRADRIRGRRRRDDLILARGGNDRVAALGGRDCVDGGRGRDRLYGGPGNDVIFGGPGRDLIDCGRGRHDLARVTRGDRTRGCERRRRRA